jgi:hypothetical protein
MGKETQAALATKLAAGTQKHLSAIAQLIIGSSTYTPAQAESELQSLAALRSAVDTAKATLKAALADEASKGHAGQEFFAAFVEYVRAAFGNSPDILADFGLSPRKTRKPLTAEQLAAAAAKRAATRAARGTRGKRAKLSIMGSVTGVVVTPITGTRLAPTASSAGTTQAASSASSTASATK